MLQEILELQNIIVQRAGITMLAKILGENHHPYLENQDLGLPMVVVW